MKRKIMLRLSYLIAFLTVFWSCHNEDFINGKAEPQRNNASFFLHAKTGGIAARGGVDYIAILEAYNREKDFLSTMPDQQGMPVWDKMQILDNGEKTILYVPLSADKTGLSSLLIVNIDEENDVARLQNFTNDYLEVYVYNADNPTAKRKLLMDTFLQMDFFTFGHQEFTNLPKDIYKGSTEYNRLNIPDVKIEAEQSKGFIYNTICTTYHFCVHGQSTSSCDYGSCTCGGLISCFLVTSCTTSATWIDDNSFPSFPGSNGGGGGPSGCNTCTNNTPPKDPCMMNTVFYRVKPGCLENAGDSGIDGLDDPCQKIITENLKAKALLNQTVIANQNTAMKAGISTSTIEKGFIFGKDASGNYKTSNIILGDSSGAQVDLPPTHTDFTAQGGIHNHTTNVYDVPSTGDIYWFMQNNYQNSNFNYYFINGVEGSIYALVITNQTDFDNFPLSHPPSQYFSSINNGWNPLKDIGKDFETSYNYFFNVLGKSDQESEELAMAFVIGKYGMGMGLSKKDSSGNFKPIFVKEISDSIDPTKKTYEITTDCNLK